MRSKFHISLEKSVAVKGDVKLVPNIASRGGKKRYRISNNDRSGINDLQYWIQS